MRGVSSVVGLCSLVLAVTLSAGAGQQPPAPGAQPPAGPKNLKVLPKTWTTQQVRALMQTFAESLGVQCSHCHAEDPNAPPAAPGRPPALDYSLDVKNEKEIGRRMIQMVMAINADSLKGLGDAAVPEKVTCFTCHAGAKTVPAQPAAGWGRGNFTLLPAGPTVPARGRGPGLP